MYCQNHEIGAQRIPFGELKKNWRGEGVGLAQSIGMSLLLDFAWPELSIGNAVWHDQSVDLAHRLARARKKSKLENKLCVEGGQRWRVDFDIAIKTTKVSVPVAHRSPCSPTALLLPSHYFSFSFLLPSFVSSSSPHSIIRKP